MYSDSSEKSGSQNWLQVFWNAYWTYPDHESCGSLESDHQLCETLTKLTKLMITPQEKAAQMWPISDCFHDNLSSTNIFFVQLFFLFLFF